MRILFEEFRSPLLRDLAILSGDFKDPQTWNVINDPSSMQREIFERIHFAEFRLGYEKALSFLHERGIVPDRLGGWSKVYGDDHDIPSVAWGTIEWISTMFRAQKKMILVEALLGTIEASPSDVVAQ